MSQVTMITLQRCVLDVFVFTVVFVFVFVFVIVFFFLVRSGHKSLGLLFECALKMYLSLSLSLYLSLPFFGQVMFHYHSDPMSQMSQVSRVTL